MLHRGRGPNICALEAKSLDASYPFSSGSHHGLEQSQKPLLAASTQGKTMRSGNCQGPYWLQLANRGPEWDMWTSHQHTHHCISEEPRQTLILSLPALLRTLGLRLLNNDNFASTTSQYNGRDFSPAFLQGEMGASKHFSNTNTAPLRDFGQYSSGWGGVVKRENSWGP